MGSPVVDGPAAAVAADEADAERRIIGSGGGMSLHETVDAAIADGTGGLAAGDGALSIDALELGGVFRLVERAAVGFRHRHLSIL
jgi:hypothetical protein